MRPDELAVGESVRVARVQGGCGLQARLAALRVVPGAEIEVVASGLCGPFIIGVDSGRLVLGRGIVRRVEVEYVGDDGASLFCRQSFSNKTKDE